MMQIMDILPFVLAWGLDLWLGDPIQLPHPVVGFGKLIAKGERVWNKGKGRLWKGALMAIILVVATLVVSDCLLGILPGVLHTLVSALLIFYCMAGTTLIREVREVFRAVDRSLEEGRVQVARIVGRDTSELSAQEVRTAALETLAENLSDGVIAPLFWYALLGVPGMLAYKMVNTMDSMIGYRNERYKEFGCFAARLDDVANYLPARFTALLMILASRRISLIKFVWKYGNQHASPNSGYPEAALAGILDCRFGGPHNYFGQEVWKPYIGNKERLFTTADMRVAVRINRLAEVGMVAIVLLLKLLGL
jgi:adenosylcobinamide-phosphate synthase